MGHSRALPALAFSLWMLAASPAAAAPTIALTWTDTTGSGIPGGSSIYAAVGDQLRLLISVTGDANGLLAAGVSLDWDGGDLTASGALECPGPENVFPEFGCTPNGENVPPFYSNDVEPGVTIDNVSGSTTQFTAVNIPGITGVFTLYVGEIFFTVEAGASIEDVSIFYQPGLDVVHDTLGNVFFPSATATIVVPEPGTAALLGLGLLGLAASARHRA